MKCELYTTGVITSRSIYSGCSRHWNIWYHMAHENAHLCLIRQKHKLFTTAINDSSRWWRSVLLSVESAGHHVINLSIAIQEYSHSLCVAWVYFQVEPFDYSPAAKLYTRSQDTMWKKVMPNDCVNCKAFSFPLNSTCAKEGMDSVWWFLSTFRIEFEINQNPIDPNG